MPNYEYKCVKCDKTFFVVMGVKEHDSAKVTCPDCRGNQVEQLISTFYSKTSKKS